METGYVAAGHPFAEPSLSQEVVQRLLAERAHLLARRPSRSALGTLTEVVICRLGDEQYAIELNRMRSVQRLTGLTAIPCTPGYVAGVLNVRGEMLTVLNLGVVFGLERPTAVAETALVLVVELELARVGLLVDEVLGLRPLAFDGLDTLPSGGDAVRGIAEGRIVVVNLDQLLVDRRFEVHEEVA